MMINNEKNITTMRHLKPRLLLTALISMVCATSFAHDIEVANSDGVKIYYNYNSKKFSRLFVVYT